MANGQQFLLTQDGQRILDDVVDVLAHAENQAHIATRESNRSFVLQRLRSPSSLHRRIR